MPYNVNIPLNPAFNKGRDGTRDAMDLIALLSKNNAMHAASAGAGALGNAGASAAAAAAGAMGGPLVGAAVGAGAQAGMSAEEAAMMEQIGGLFSGI